MLPGRTAQGAEKLQKLLGGDGGGLGEDALPPVDLVDLVRLEVHAVQVGRVALDNGQRDGADLKALLQLRGGVAGAVGGQDDRFHGKLLFD